MEDHSEKIQDYIEGLLEGNDLVQFEAQLAVDIELRNMLALQREVQEILLSRVVSRDVELRETLNGVSTNFRHHTNDKTFPFKRYIPFIALACVLVIGWFLFINNASNPVYELPKMRSEIVRGQSESIMYEHALKAYNDKDYEGARIQLDVLLKSNPTQIQYQYYLGLAYIGENQLERAVLNLLPIANGVSVFANEAKYYLGLCYFKQNDNEKALDMLKRIPSNSVEEVKAKKLINEIK